MAKVVEKENNNMNTPDQVKLQNTPQENIQIDKEEENEKLLLFIYIVIVLTNILVNFDHGIIPAATDQIKLDLAIDDVELGILGSVVYAGLLAGSLAASQLFQVIQTKIIIISTIIAYQASLALFLITDNIYILGLSRTLVGFFQVFLVVYFPVWIDMHGGKKQTLWLTFLQLGVPLGVVLGYCCTGFYMTYFQTWQYSFITQIILLIPCGACLAIQSNKNLNVQGKQQKQSIQKLQRTRSSLMDPNITVIGRTSVSPEILQRQKSYMENLQNLFSNKLFLYSMLCLCSLYFVVTGIQFWISDYFQFVLLQPKSKVVMYFTVVSITAPTLGVVVGGYILDKFGGPPEGGYTGAYALDICCLKGLLSALCGIPIPFIDNFMVVIVLLWFMLFFGGALMPGAMGIMISSIPSELRAFGNSTAQLFSNLLGYLPAPMLYGIVNKQFSNTTQRAGMVMLTFWGLQGVIYLILGKNFKQKIENEMEEETAESQEMVDLSQRPSQVLQEQQNVVNQDDYIPKQQQQQLRFQPFRPKGNTQILEPLLEYSHESSGEINKDELKKQMIEQKYLKQSASAKQLQKNNMNKSESTGSLHENNPAYRKTVLKLKRMGTSSLDPQTFMPLKNKIKISSIQQTFQYNQYDYDQENQNIINNNYEQSPNPKISTQFGYKKKIPQRISYISMAQLLGKSNSIYIDTEDQNLEQAYNNINQSNNYNNINNFSASQQI